MTTVKNIKGLSKSANLAGIAGGKASVGVPREAVHLRSSWFLSCKDWLRSFKGISLFINPSEVQWSLPRREQMTKTAAGVVRNTWRNRFRQSYYDEPTLSITFQAGNIIPSAGLPNAVLDDIQGADAYAKAPTPSPGLQNFYEFLELLDQPMLTGNTENYHVIFYRSRIFPRMRLEGYFIGSTPLAFTDSATNGNTLTWTSSFQVYRSFPAFNNYSLLVNEWSKWAKAEVMASEIFPVDYNFAFRSALAKSDRQATKNEADARKKAILKEEFVGPPEEFFGPPDPNDPNKTRKLGLVAGSVAGKDKTAQTPVTAKTLGQLLAGQKVTDKEARAIANQLDVGQFYTRDSVIPANPDGTPGTGYQPGNPYKTLTTFDAKSLDVPYASGGYSGTTAINGLPGAHLDRATGKVVPSPFSKK